MKNTKWSKAALSIVLCGSMALAGASSFAGQNVRGDRSGFFVGKFDVDGDGKVSREEFLEHFNDLDENGDGFIDSSEAPRGPHPRHDRNFGNLIEKLDSDKDGKLSRAEYRGPDRHFERLDANGDGYITENEIPGRSSE